MQRVLFLCTGNSARSQMAEALLRYLGGNRFEVFSAGIKPKSEVNPFVIEVLKERNIPTEGLRPKPVNELVKKNFDLVVTVCDRAKQSCPHFPGAKQIEHWSLEDPAEFQGTNDEILIAFRETCYKIERRIREEILKQ
ncbi:MAG: arsenate reductase ArsC [Promethearchaeota archaeon]